MSKHRFCQEIRCSELRFCPEREVCFRVERLLRPDLEARHEARFAAERERADRYANALQEIRAAAERVMHLDAWEEPAANIRNMASAALENE